MELSNATLSIEVVMSKPRQFIPYGSSCGYGVEGLTKEGRKPFKASYFDLTGWDCYAQDFAPSEAKSLSLQVVWTTPEGDIRYRWSDRVSLASGLEIMKEYFEDIYIFENP